MKKRYLILAVFVGFCLLYLIISRSSAKIELKNTHTETYSNPTQSNAKADPISYPSFTKTIPIKKQILSITKAKTISPPKTTPTEIIEDDQSNLPKSIADIKITPKLQDFFDKYWSGSTEKIDFRLRLFDELSKCLGPQAPTSGDILMNFLFKTNFESKTATGIEARDDNPIEQQAAFQIRRSNLSAKDEEQFIVCIREAHIGLVMNISDKLAKENGIISEYFYHPISIHFPLEDDIIYWLLAHEGEPPPK